MIRDRIALFGGSFNPPHIGHIGVAEAAIEQFRLEEVRWIPNQVSPFKVNEQVLEAEHRLAMTELAARVHPSFSVSDIEIERGGTSFTVDTVEVIRKERPKCTLFLLLGEDAYADFDAFHKPERIRELAELIVYPRARVTADSITVAPGDHLLIGEYLDVSSSLIRSLIAEGKPTDPLLPVTVRDYIVEHRLYSNL